MSARPRLVPVSLVAPVLLVAVAALAGGCGTEPAPAGSGAAPTATSAVTPPSTPAPSSSEAVQIAYAGGEVTGGTQRIPVPLGGVVTLEITGDVADEVHVHGYEEYVEVVPGAPATVSFPADIPGVFEVDLHDSGLVLAQLEVS